MVSILHLEVVRVCLVECIVMVDVVHLVLVSSYI